MTEMTIIENGKEIQGTLYDATYAKTANGWALTAEGKPLQKLLNVNVKSITVQVFIPK